MTFKMKNNSNLKNVVSVDKDTGEKIEGVIVICGLKRNPYAKGWIMNSQEALKLLATNEELTGENYKVLLYLLAILDFENWIQISQKEIANDLNMQKQRISRSIKKLEQKEIILRGEKIGRSFLFRLNPFYGWKGKVKTLEEYKREKEKERIENLKNKTNERKQKKLEQLSKKFHMSFEELQEVQTELNLSSI